MIDEKAIPDGPKKTVLPQFDLLSQSAFVRLPTVMMQGEQV